MKIALCQIDPIIGHLEYNKQKILDGYKKAIEAKADLAIFPELSLVGYPPLDLVEKQEFRTAVNNAAKEIALQTKEVGLIFGAITEDNDKIGTDIHNSAILCFDGKIQFVQHKTLIPNYDVFDEMRYFDSAKSVSVFDFKGEKLGISICEDIWNDEDYWYRRRYHEDPVKELLKKYSKPENFINRDLSWVEFNKRVLEEALNPELPLLEKIKFISIFCSNLDEFYMIRISGIKEQIAANVEEPSIDGLTPIEQLRKIEKALKPLLKNLDNYWMDYITPALKENNIKLLSFNDISEADKAKLTEYFKKEVYPVLTPLAFDPGRPFPYISNLSLSLAILIRKPNGENHFARVKVPSILPRLLEIDNILEPKKSSGVNGNFTATFIWLGDLIKANLHLLFLEWK